MSRICCDVKRKYFSRSSRILLTSGRDDKHDRKFRSATDGNVVSLYGFVYILGYFKCVFLLNFHAGYDHAWFFELAARLTTP